MAGHAANVATRRRGSELARRGKIFICYRRRDEPGGASRLYDRLIKRFGKANVFMDVDNLLPGQRFDRELDKALSQCDVLIAVIGSRWMELLYEYARGRKRDFVREEIAEALKRDIVVIPVLIGLEEYMPSLPQRDDLPEEIRDLVLHQKYGITYESFDRDAGRYPEMVRLIYQRGRIAQTSGDYGEARKWYRMAATQGHPGAMNDLGVLYCDELGGATDFLAARNLFDKAQALSYVPAMFSLGVFYTNGRGVPEDPKQARQWFQKAANAGDKRAKAILRQPR
jgi:tetratricopeptide (TPR) repeat protein